MTFSICRKRRQLIRVRMSYCYQSPLRQPSAMGRVRSMARRRSLKLHNKWSCMIANSTANRRSSMASTPCRPCLCLRIRRQRWMPLRRPSPRRRAPANWLSGWVASIRSVSVSGAGCYRRWVGRSRLSNLMPTVICATAMKIRPTATPVSPAGFWKRRASNRCCN